MAFFSKALIALIVGAISVFGGEFLVRTDDPSKVPGKILKRIDSRTYLVRIEERVSGLNIYRGKVLIEKNYRLKALRTPNDPCLSYRWDLSFIKASEAWDLSTGSGNVYVALLDTGVDYNHRDLKENLWVNSDENCTDGVDNDGNGYVDDCYGIDTVNGDSDPMDDNGHGTALAGVIGAVGNNGELIPGVNWRVKIIPCKFLNSAGEGDIAGEIECLEYILRLKRDKGLNIVAVNASYGAVYPESQIQKDKIRELAQEGILYITAAGNEGLNNEEIKMHPCNYDLENMVCVGSVDKKGVKPSFSNYGFSKVKISAPGEDIRTLSYGNSSSSCEGLVSVSGTSISTSFVSGAVALLKSYNPSLSYEQVRLRLLTSGRNNPQLSGQTYTCNLLDLYSLMGNDSTPKLCASSLYLEWGNVSECMAVDRTFVLRNTGNTPLRITEVYTEGRGFWIARNGCLGRTLNTLEECTVVVSFRPMAEGEHRGNLYVRFSNSGMDISVSLRADSSAVCGKGGCGSFSSWAGILGLIAVLRLILKRRL
jgi:subtilisin family serine protease